VGHIDVDCVRTLSRQITLPDIFRLRQLVCLALSAVRHLISGGRFQLKDLLRTRGDWIELSEVGLTGAEYGPILVLTTFIWDGNDYLGAY
jgi:hypothetical protein